MPQSARKRMRCAFCRAERLIGALQAFINAKRTAEAEEAQRQAERAREAVSPEHPALLELAEESKTLADDLARIEAALPIGWTYGDRYSVDQWIGPERYA